MSTYVLVREALVEQFLVPPVDIRSSVPLKSLGLTRDDTAELLAGLAARFDAELPAGALDHHSLVEDVVTVAQALRTSGRRGPQPC